MISQCTPRKTSEDEESTQFSSWGWNDSFPKFDQLPPAPSTSYIYNKERKLLFKDAQQFKSSFLPSFEFNAHQVSFTFDRGHAILCNDQIFHSFKEFAKKIGFPEILDQNLLDKIAKIANYLSTGQEYKFITESSYVKEGTLFFKVEKKEHHYNAKLSSFPNSDRIKYILV